MADSTRPYGTGRRKDAIARVWLQPGTGTITVNGQPIMEYVNNRQALVAHVLTPFEVTGTVGQFDVVATTKGGGISGQAGALRHGISCALVESNEELRIVLRRGGFLTRDPRVKERKKYGRKRARRGFQFSKR